MYFNTFSARLFSPLDLQWRMADDWISGGDPWISIGDLGHFRAVLKVESF